MLHILSILIVLLAYVGFIRAMAQGNSDRVMLFGAGVIVALIIVSRLF